MIRCACAAEHDHFLPGSVGYPFDLYSFNGQNVAVLKPAFSASIAACELRRPVFQVNTNVVSLGISFSFGSSCASGMLIAPLIVSA
jgi:hypothetical protein